MSARRLTAGEVALARSVFADAIDYERVRIAPGGFGRFTVTVGSRIHARDGDRPTDFAREGLGTQGVFIHELVHVWQFQTRALATLASWARVVLTGGYGRGLPGYRYVLPLAPWPTLNLEQQASVVEHAFLLHHGRRSPAMPPGAHAGAYRGATPFAAV